MVLSHHHSRSCWSAEDVQRIQQGLAQNFPHISTSLRNAIILLSIDEVAPAEGFFALQQRVTSFAYNCPTQGMPSLASLV